MLSEPGIGVISGCSDEAFHTIISDGFEFIQQWELVV
jgi:hypothetical protein